MFDKGVRARSRLRLMESLLWNVQFFLLTLNTRVLLNADWSRAQLKNV